MEDKERLLEAKIQELEEEKSRRDDEIQARGELNAFWDKISYEFEQKITIFENEVHTRFANCTSETDLSNVHVERKRYLLEITNTIFHEKEEKLNQFFT